MKMSAKEKRLGEITSENGTIIQGFRLTESGSNEQKTRQIKNR